VSSRHCRIRCCSLETEGTLPIVCPACGRTFWNESGRRPTPPPLAQPTAFYEEPLYQQGFLFGLFVGVGLTLVLVAVFR